MFHSGEMRWFLRGELPPGTRDWFENDGSGECEPPRVDDYLVLPHCRTASLKSRDGRIEFKARTGAPQATSYDHGIAGYRDTWVKWSSKAGDRDDMDKLFVHEEDQWLSVEKRRHLRLISLTASEPTEVRPGRDWPPRGCQVELTSIRIWPSDRDETLAIPCWSFSFEAFNDPDTVLDDLDRAINYFLKESPPFRLDHDSSMSYPVWLNALFDAEAV